MRGRRPALRWTEGHLFIANVELRILIWKGTRELQTYRASNALISSLGRGSANAKQIWKHKAVGSNSGLCAALLRLASGKHVEMGSSGIKNISVCRPLVGKPRCLVMLSMMDCSEKALNGNLTQAMPAGAQDRTWETTLPRQTNGAGLSGEPGTLL